MKYTPRLTAPSKTDKRFINYKNGGYNTCIAINKQTGYVMPNCVGYAQGRFLEVTGSKAINWKLPACNAEDWFETAKNNGFKTGQTPKLGAVIVWRAGAVHNSSDGAGHVAVVEQIKSNGDIVVSQSAYGGTEFYTSTVTKASGYLYSSNRPLLGFIYCGIEFENETPTVDTSVVAGKEVTLSSTNCYTSESAPTPYTKKSGKFYLWDNTVSNGRIRITNSITRVGVAGQVTCWVAIADVGLVASNTTKVSYKSGAKVALNNTACYVSESAPSSYGVKTGTYYIWSPAVLNGRIRITNAPERAGVAGQVTCWVKVSDIKLV